MGWLQDHIYIAQWLAPIVTVFAVLVALFGQQFWAWWRRPILKIEFEEKEPFVRETNLQNGKRGEWVRVRVRNVGRSPAQRCIPMLVAVTSDSGERQDIDPMQLRWAGVPRSQGYKPMNLANGDFAYVNVLVTEDDWHHSRFVTFESADYDPGFPQGLLHKSAHRVRVTLTSDTAQPASRTIDFPKGGFWGAPVIPSPESVSPPGPSAEPPALSERS
jgi:hypothetical protein